MNTMQLIHKISESPEIKIVVLGDMDDKAPMEAISYLSALSNLDEEWQVNSSLEKGTLLVYGNGIKIYE